MNFYKHFIGDYARDTAHLSLMEHGAYRVLLDTCYATGKPLPAAYEALYRIAKAFTAAERKAVERVADQFFPLNGDGNRHNHRADVEIAGALAYADAQAKRAQMRWHEQPHKPLEYPDDASHSHSQKRTKSSCANDFARFWSAYPRKKSKGQAERAFAKLNPNEQLMGLMLSAIERAKTSEPWLEQAGKFIPYPASWLNAKGWEDELPEPPDDNRMGKFVI